jgi:hypothetical protein
MKTIWFFGDSNTEIYNPQYKWTRDYIDWKGYTPKHWTEVLSEKLEIPYKNLGVGGCDNYTIFDSLINNLDSIKDDDIIVIGWSTPIRGRIVNLDVNKWFTIVPMGEPNLKCISNQSIWELVSLRDSELYINEVLGWQKLIKKALVNNKVIFWSVFIEFYNKGIVDSKYWSHKRLSIKDETNGDVIDNHFSETGCKIVSDAMYDYIKYQNRLI